jgi:hypothetical protein
MKKVMRNFFYPVILLLITTSLSAAGERRPTEDAGLSERIGADIKRAENESVPLQTIIRERLSQAVKQYEGMAQSLIDQPDRVPCTADAAGRLITTSTGDWVSGFVAGTLWYLYQYTGREDLKAAARNYTERLEKEQYNRRTHDLGFMLYCSYGNGLRLTGDTAYIRVLLTGAGSLASRYNSAVGCIRSWDHNREKWQFPVIVDNMMNLEYLFWAARIGKNPAWYDICISHADKTVANHFRSDGSSYHVVSYDTVSGAVQCKNTAQGFADESAWARGQAWGLYGFTMMYRETKVGKYLVQAQAIASFILNHRNLPADGIPYWDFDTPDVPTAQRDASAGAIIASALLELSRYVDSATASKYIGLASKQLRTLSSPAYFAEPGTNAHFLLRHSVGSIPHKSQIDVPLTYADYYYVEAMLRYLEL